LPGVSAYRQSSAHPLDDWSNPVGPVRILDAGRLPALAALGILAMVLGNLFNGINGPASLGELSADGALAGTMIIIASAILSGSVLDVRGARALLLYTPLVLCVLLSYAVNADDIKNAHFLGREGPEKFRGSLLVLGLYLALFYSFFCLMAVYGVNAVLRVAGAAAMLATWMLIFEMTLEVATWFSPPLRSVWLSVRHLWTYSTLAELHRLVGFGSEPSFGAITALGLIGLLAMPCAAAGWRVAAFDGGTWFAILSLALLLLFQLIGDARTFMAGALGGGLAAVLLSRPFRRLPAAVKSATIMLAPLVAQAIAIWSVYSAAPGTRTESNIGRTVGMLSATKLWSQHPLFGLGLGQYGFHFRAEVPSWGLQSWEVSRYFKSAQFDMIGATGLPPSYSIFSRLGTELGIIGFLAWVLPAVYAMRRALIRAPGPLTTLMICAFAAQIWTGLSLDSFRNVYYWLWLAALLALPGNVAQPRPHPAGAVRPPAFGNRTAEATQ
jgi:hypothetical protein